MSAKQIILKSLANDDLKKVIQLLFHLADRYNDEELSINIALQSSRINELDRQVAKGVISSEEYYVQSAKIKTALLRSIRELDDDWRLDKKGVSIILQSLNPKKKKNRVLVYIGLMALFLIGFIVIFRLNDKKSIPQQQPIKTSINPNLKPNVSTTGDQSPAIHTDDGDVNVNYGGATLRSDTSSLLKNIEQ